MHRKSAYFLVIAVLAMLVIGIVMLFSTSAYAKDSHGDVYYFVKRQAVWIAAGFAEAFLKWPTGSYLLWYPVKNRRASDGLARHVAGVAGAAVPAAKCLRLEFSIAPQAAGAALTSTGLLIVNPPWTLAGELKAILPELQKPLGLGGAGRYRRETPKP